MFISKKQRSFYKRKWNLSEICDLLIIVEHTVRELETAVVIASRLEKLGFNVAIDSPKWNINRLPELYKPKCVLVPWVYSSKEMNVWVNFRDSNNNKSVLINFHHEQITGENSMDFILPNDNSKDVYHICWGTNYYEKIESLVPKGSRILSGSPRLELSKIISQSQSLEIKDKYNLGDYNRILYIANSLHLQTESEREYFETLGVSLKKMAESGISNTKKALKNFDKLLNDHKNIQIIYRPHPSMIDRERKFKLLMDLNHKYPKRFKIIGDKSIHHWIKISDVVLTFHSTCFAEAYMLKKPFALFRFDKMPVNDEPEIFNLVKKLTNYNELEKFLINPKFESIPNFEKFYYNEKVDSFKTILDFIKKSIKGYHKPLHLKPTTYQRITNYSLFHIKFFLNRIGQFSFFEKIFSRSKNYKINNFVWMSGSDAYNFEDIEEYKRLHK